MRVTALLYSGRPNPSWDLDDAQAARIAQAIDALEPARDRRSDVPGLGYAGVRVELSDRQGGPEAWLFSGGLARSGRGCFVDANQRIEKALLETGAKQDVDPHLADLI